MCIRHWIVSLCFVALLATRTLADSDQFTALVASTLTAEVRPVPATDHRLHFVYELLFTNTNATPATLKRIDVTDAANPSKIFATYGAQDLQSRLRRMDGAPVENSSIEYNGSRLFLIDLTFNRATTLPTRLLHHLNVESAPMPGHEPVTPVPLSYAAAYIAISHLMPEIGPPLAGKGWVAVNGCCGPNGVHRATGLAINGRIYYAQRFAIDWMRLDKNGRLVNGDPSDVHSYADYGADVLAIADGTVIDTLNNLNDQKPGTLPNPKTITIENVDGNHIILDLGHGVFALYAHLQEGSVSVKPGDKVKPGQVIAKLGNTGNTSAPHLHFQLMESPSALGSNGIPYILKSFAFAGQISPTAFNAAVGVEGDWSKSLLPTATPTTSEFPLNLNVIDFQPGK